MKPRNVLVATLCISLVALLSTGALQAQHDPGPRAGTPVVGGPYPTLNAAEQAIFVNGLGQFTEVNDSVPRVNGNGGLGPGFNSNGCASCHSQPMALGTSPSPSSPQVPQQNPQIAAGLSTGAKNVIPSFIMPDGPVREARFIRNSDGTLDGGVHDLFSIAGRTDAPGCNLPQPNFAAQLNAKNVIFRIPTPLFGLGLVENTPDAVLKANLAATASSRSKLGIKGRFNTSGNTGNITKFGWKAQNPSLEVFAGEAYNVEMGITNDNFSDERNAFPGCMFNGMPEDSHPDSDIDGFTDAMRLSAPPVPTAATTSTSNGQALFESVGCSLCHSENLTTAQSNFTGMSFVTYHPLSDYALHHMGENLEDGINQGVATGDEFRTAPLWGIGQRLFFLHDGRTSDLLQAIEAHADCAGKSSDRDDNHDRSRHSHCGSEANGVLRNFNNLNPSQVQDILNFLRSL